MKHVATIGARRAVGARLVDRRRSTKTTSFLSSYSVLLALFFLFSLCRSASSDSFLIAESQRAALSDVIDGFVGKKPSSWVYTRNCSDWLGIGCDENGFVASINLLSFGFGGVLKSSIGQLTSLRYLNLGNNSLQGALPSSLGYLNLTYLNVYNNQFSGQVPSSISQLKYLSFLNIANNSFQRPLPSSFGKLNLTYLNMNSNQFSGGIPSWILQLKYLSVLDLNSNQFSGEIPAWLGQLKYLSVLRLCCNQLTKSIPSSFYNLRYLSVLDVSRNQLSGRLPSFLGQINLMELYLSGNRFNGNLPAGLFSGTFVQLDLSSNLFVGSIPSQIKNLFISEKLNFSNNYLSSIPQGLNDFYNGYNAFNRVEDVSGNCILTYPRDWAASSRTKQRSASACKAFCGSNSKSGACRGHGYCYFKGKTPTCACYSGYKLSKNTCVKA